MQVPHNAFVLVADGRKMLFLRNEGDGEFPAETAELLKKRALNNDFESLIIIAPPKTLGELRKHYHKEVESRITLEIDKDLTGHTVPQIEEALAKAE